MEITEKFQDNIALIYLDERFDANTAGDVEQTIRALIDKGTYQFVLDLGKVPFIASAGLRVILATAKELRQGKKGDLRVASLQDSPMKVFEISGLDNVLQLFKDAESAAESFSN